MNEMTAPTQLEQQVTLGEQIRRALITNDLQKQLGANSHDKNHSIVPREAPWEFNASRDTKYSHPPIAAFENVVTVFTQEWVGIRAAAGGFPSHKLAISKSCVWSPDALLSVIDKIDELGIRKIVAHGLSAPVIDFLIAVRKVKPKLGIFGVWHGTAAAWFADEERMLAFSFLELADSGVFDKIHFLRRGMHILHAKASKPLLPNPVPRVDLPRLVPAWSQRPGTCVFGSWNNMWKNMYANIAAAAASKSVKKILSYSPGEFPGVGRSKITRLPFPGRDGHFAILSVSDLVLNATITDCHPMLELEALAVGTPSLHAGLDLDFGTDHAYERMFSVTSPHNIAEITHRIDEIAATNSTEIANVVADYRKLVTNTSFARYSEFLQG